MSRVRSTLRRSAAYLLLAFLLALASACQIEAICPATPEAAISGQSSAITADTLIFTGHVIRYVEAPNLEARGYDLSVSRWLKGRPSPEGTFLRVTRAVPGIRAGQPVMIIAEPGPRDPISVPGSCLPLVPIAEDQV